MNKILKKIILLSLLALMLGGFSERAYAQVPTVQFENAPLFSEVKFAPGDSVKRFVKVTNNTTENHRTILRAVNVTSTGELKDVIGLVIKDGDTVLYDNTFADLFSRSEVVLTQVAPGGQKTFDFIVTFKNTAGNEYQNSTMGFNLVVGLEDVTETSDTTTAISGQQGGGGGGGNGPVVTGQKNLIISGESASATLSPESGDILINWYTNLPATSQVVYGLASRGPYSLNLTAQNFGYPLSSVENISKVTSHMVYLSDITPGQLYVFRVVSKASPATVGNEFTFMLNQDGTTRAVSPLAVVTSDENSNVFSSGGTNESGTEEQGDGIVKSVNVETASSENNDTVNDNTGQLAAAFLGAGWLTWQNFMWIFLVLLIIFLFIIWKRKKREDK